MQDYTGNILGIGQCRDMPISCSSRWFGHRLLYFIILIEPEKEATQMIKFTGMEYLKIDIANCYGLDKKSWQERIEWVNQNESKLETLESKADEPAEYWAAVCAYRQAQKGEVVHHGIHLDATSSGAQWLSVLSDDIEGAKLCNVINTGERKDLYTSVYKTFAQKVHNDPFITRDKVKKAVMVSLYGSKAGPKEVFGEEHIDQYEDVMSTCMPRAWQINNLLVDNWLEDRDIYRWVMPDNFHVNLTVKVKKEKEFLFNNKLRTFICEETGPSPYGRSLGPGMIHSIDAFAVREITALAMHDPEHIKNIKDYMNGTSHSLTDDGQGRRDVPRINTLVELYKKSGYLSARILDYLDRKTIHLVPEEELRELLSLVPEKPFQVAAVHKH